MRSIHLLRSLMLGVLLAGVASYTERASAATQVLIEIDDVWSYEASNTDLGDGWKETGFDDSSWPTGAAAIGYPANENLPLTTVQTDVTRTTPVTPTIYFRKHFTFTGDPAGVTLVSSNLIDDGAVFYLNGTEVGRIAMPEGPVVFSTIASRANDIGGTRIDELSIPAASLVSGDNVLAVRVHQGSTTSSDMIFASKLVVNIPTAGPPIFLSDPLSQEVGQGEPVTFSVTVDGTRPYSFQWLKDGAEIPGATGSSYSIPNAGNGDEGVYSVVVSNPLGEAVSEGALLTVLDGPVTLVSFGTVWSYDDSNMDLGTEWREVGFNDGSWSSGPSPLGFPAGESLPDYPAGSGTPLTVETELVRTVGNFAYYFRNHFNFEGEPLDFELDITTLFDDAAIIYLNGQELLRVGMAEGTVNAGTQADRTVGDAGFETFTLPADLLLDGPNVLAVESHQVSSGSSDIIMGLRIVALPLPPTRIGILEQPVAVEVEELKAASFSVGIVGNTPRFQWFRIDGSGDNPIAGATRPTYAIENTVLADDGAQFYVVISNIVNRVVSETVTLTVIPDVLAPLIVVADGTLNATTIVVSYNELVDETSAERRANYELAATDGGANLNISNAVLTNGTNVVLTTAARVNTKNYILTINGVKDIAPIANVIATDSMRPVSSLFELIRFAALWEYWDPHIPFDELPLTGTEWRTDPEWDVAEQTPPGEYYLWFWRTGNGALVNDGGGELELPVDTRKQLLQTGFVTSYFRTVFAFAGASPAGAAIRMRHLVDDGAVFYLNGVEIARFNMPEGPILSDTPAASTVGAASFERVDIPISALVSGDNLLAVEVHQRGGRDIDKVFALELIATVESLDVGPVVITSAPSDQTVTEGQPVTFTYVGAAGASFQWRENGVAITGATEPVYTIPAVPLSANGKRYSVVVSNDRGSETSGEGTLTVLPDTIPPKPVSAFANGNLVTVTFNEPVGTVSGNRRQNYIVTKADGSTRTVQTAVTAGRTVTLTLGSTVAVGDQIRIMNIADASVAGNIMPESCLFTIGLGGVFMDWDHVWRYEDSDTDLGTDWRSPGYNDASWLSGPGLFGEEGASLPQPLRTTIAAPAINPNPPSGGPNTSYYRTDVNIPLAASQLVLRYIVDDGAVFYLNGTEVHRIRVAAGQVHTDFASGGVGDAVEETVVLTIPPGLLNVGQNLMSAEVHQTSATSSDTVFGARLELEQIPSQKIFEPTPPTVSIRKLPSGAVRVSWEIAEGSFVLEQAIRLSGPWIPFPASATAPPATFVDRPAFGSARWFRLRQQ